MLIASASVMLKIGRLAALLAVAAAIGCAAQPKPIGKVAVQEFDIVPAALFNETQRDPFEPGMRVAEHAVRMLQAWGRDATAVSREQSPTGDLIVSGRVTRLDGGSRGARIAMSLLLGFGWTSYGVGGASCGVEGEVVTGDGAQIGAFRESWSKKSTGWFWIRYGESARQQLTACLRAMGKRVAMRVNEGRYMRPSTLSEPRSMPVVEESAYGGTTAERLRKLDALRERRLISDSEYQEQRRRILGEL